MTKNLRPLAAALGIALTVAAGGVALATSKHRNHTPAKPNAWSGGLITLAPDPPSTPTPPAPPIVHPATGVDLIWATVPGHDQLLAAYDWSGMVRGSFTLPAPHMQLGPVTTSGDGQRLLISMPDDSVHVFTAQGVDLGRLAAESPRGVDFAGDDTHFCNLTNNGTDTAATLSLLTLGAPARTVTTVHWPEGDGGPRLAACNVVSDLAVMVTSLGDDAAGHVVEYRVVRLSTGATLRDVHPPGLRFDGSQISGSPGALWDVTSSSDGKLLLLMPWSADPAVKSMDWQIADSVSGRVLAHVTASHTELVGDGRWMLTDDHLVDWRTHATIAAPPRCCDSAGIDPAGDTFVVGIPTGPPPTPVAQGATSSSADQPPPDDLVILHPDGRVVRLACCGATLV